MFLKGLVLVTATILTLLPKGLLFSADLIFLTTVLSLFFKFVFIAIFYSSFVSLTEPSSLITLVIEEILAPSSNFTSFTP